MFEIYDGKENIVLTQSNTCLLILVPFLSFFISVDIDVALGGMKAGDCFDRIYRIYRMN
jgi:hypothetical protein